MGKVALCLLSPLFGELLQIRKKAEKKKEAKKKRIKKEIYKERKKR